MARTFSMKSWTSLKMGHVRSKMKSLRQILGNRCVRSRGNIFSLILKKIIRMFAKIKFQMSSKMGHVESKTRSIGQFLGKQHCVWSRVHIFSLILMKLGQKACLYNMIEV